jgi:hypothetical protein
VVKLLLKKVGVGAACTLPHLNFSEKEKLRLLCTKLFLRSGYRVVTYSIITPVIKKGIRKVNFVKYEIY